MPPTNPMQSEWFDISTAPKDGTWILTGYEFQGNWVFRLCRHHKTSGTWQEMPSCNRGYPTHWQPLPKPPEAK
jgi:hypothetical protein